MLLPQRETEIHSTVLFHAKGIQFERQIFCSKLVPHCQDALQEAHVCDALSQTFGNLSKDTFYLINMSYIKLDVCLFVHRWWYEDRDQLDATQ